MTIATLNKHFVFTFYLDAPGICVISGLPPVSTRPGPACAGARGWLWQQSGAGGQTERWSPGEGVTLTVRTSGTSPVKCEVTCDDDK